MNIVFRKTMTSFNPKIEAAGFKEIKPGLYDTRNWDFIRTWAKELATRASCKIPLNPSGIGEKIPGHSVLLAPIFPKIGQTPRKIDLRSRCCQFSSIPSLQRPVWHPEYTLVPHQVIGWVTSRMS
jgi:hypothetical protein